VGSTRLRPCLPEREGGEGMGAALSRSMAVERSVIPFTMVLLARSWAENGASWPFCVHGKASLGDRKVVPWSSIHSSAPPARTVTRRPVRQGCAVRTFKGCPVDGKSMVAKLGNRLPVAQMGPRDERGWNVGDEPCSDSSLWPPGFLSLQILEERERSPLDRAHQHNPNPNDAGTSWGWHAVGTHGSTAPRLLHEIAVSLRGDTPLVTRR